MPTHWKMYSISTRLTSCPTRNKALLLLVAGWLVFHACTRKEPSPEKKISERLLTQIDSFSVICTSLQTAVTNDADSVKLRQLFLDSRLAYKRIEWAAEYFDPTAAKIVNGPPVQEVELDGRVIDPAGLQIMEADLYPAYNPSHKQELLAQLQRIQAACAEYKRHFTHIDILNWQVFDATQLEVYRVMTLGLVGFDDPLSQKSMPEAAAALSSMKEVLALYTH